MSSPAERIDKLAAAERGPLRFVSAASLFDGHDAAINIIRRILQAHGAEVVHLGHNRSVADIVRAAIQEDADGVAVSSYQGGHNEYFRYMVDMLKAEGAGHVKVVVGGGGTIAPHEVSELESYGIEKIYTPDDGLRLGLDGMIEDVFRRVRSTPRPAFEGSAVTADDPVRLARAITLLELGGDEAAVARLRGHGREDAEPAAGARHHGHRWRRQVVADRRAAQSHRAFLPRPSRSRRRDGPDATPVGRGAAR